MYGIVLVELTLYQPNILPLHFFVFILVYRAFDTDSDGFVNMEEWVHGLSVFLRGTLDQQTQCKYQIY